ncbi:NUDIX domain-containing protein [Chryseolinea lacunae]|uniref:NUDIX domain-containing protein n=1 Tax=Chryseolinea lacunae TaxID=2801331 RepID=A0ABS1KUL9_9BACT|nr:NUDIX domain-containing protein [Chryseolinea lacunae]MBL0742011.1 NUDIX domain-containing protein [Chryseolinea lacunae]
MNNIGVIIARFQTPYLHDGHKALIETVQQQHNKTVIVLGISPVLGSRRNPLDFPTREKMIKKEYPDMVVLPLSDHPLDAKWTQNLDTLLSSTFPGSTFTLYGSRDSFMTSYSGSKKVVPLAENGPHNSTALREKFSDKVIDSEAFRSGIIYAYANTYVKVYPTVDIAVFRNDKTELLLGKKDIDNKWRLLGGFSDPTDDSYEMAAERELREECGPIEITGMRYEKSFRVDDWRYKREADKIITTLFSTDFIAGDPKGSDDIADVDWFALEKVEKMLNAHEVAEEHYPQLQNLLEKYLTK